MAAPQGHSDDTKTYGVVPKGLLTFLGSLYKEGAKTTSGTWAYRFEKKKKKPPEKEGEKKFFPPKTLCSQLRMQDFISGTRHNR